MKRINSIIIAAIAIMAMSMSSCKKDVALQRAEQEEAGTISVSVDAVMGEYAQDDASKAGLVSTTRVRWQDMDVVYVFDGAKCLGKLLVTLKDGKDYYACLNSLDFAPLLEPQAGTTKLTLVYSNAFKSEPSIITGTFSQTSQLPLSLSTQDGDTKPDNIPFLAFATLDYTTGSASINGQVADFRLATSLMKLNCTGLEAGKPISGAILKGMSNECLLKITKDGPEIIQGNMGDINVYFKGVSANAKGTQTLYAAVAQNLTESAQTLEIQQTKKYCYNFGSKARNAAKAYNAICPLVKPLPADALPGEFSVSDTKKVYFSKGNLVATINASGAPTAWKFSAHQYDFLGEGGANKTIGASAGDIDLFGWSTSTNGGTSTFDNYGIMTSKEYIYYSGEFYDWGKAVGDGNTWRTLSRDEWTYLFNNNSNKWVTVNGVKGYVIAPDGFDGTLSNTYADDDALAANNLVFLPAAGFRAGSELRDVGASGYYWSSTANAYDTKSAHDVHFNINYVGPDSGGTRYFGYCVRLITECQ